MENLANGMERLSLLYPTPTRNNMELDDTPISFCSVDQELRQFEARDTYTAQQKFDFICMTLNIGKQGTVFVDQRKPMIENSFRETVPHLFMIQETTWKLLASNFPLLNRSHWIELPGNSVRSAKDREVSIIYDNRCFKNVSPPDMEPIIVETMGQSEISVNERERIEAAILEFQPRAIRILVISWHSDVNGYLNERFVTFCCKLVGRFSPAMMTPIPLLIGGDFNAKLTVTTTDVFQEALSGDSFYEEWGFDDRHKEFHLYIPTQICYRVPKSVDFFIANSALHLSGVTEIPENSQARGESFDRVMVNIELEHGHHSKARIMDHMPVIANVLIDPILISFHLEEDIQNTVGGAQE